MCLYMYLYINNSLNVGAMIYIDICVCGMQFKGNVLFMLGSPLQNGDSE